MRRSLLVLASLAGLLTSSARAQTPPADTLRARLSTFAPAIDSMLAAWQVPGVGIAIVRGKEVVFSGGYGKRDVERDLPVTSRTLFAIGSSTKAFTTFTVATLVQDARLSWDAPVRSFLPWFQLYDKSAGERLTVRDLVTHRSGLPRHDAMWYNNNRDTREELVRRLAYLPPNKDLRELWQYNNLMYLTAGYLIEQQTGGTWESAVRERIFQPLGMKASTFSVKDAERSAEAARPYDVRKDTLTRIPYRDISLIGPAGSIMSTPDDMARWVALHLAGGRTGDKQLLRPDLLREMYQSHMAIQGSGFSPADDPDDGPTSYGLGWFLTTYRGHALVHHGGNIDGFSALVAMLPRDSLGFVVLTNRNATPVPMLLVRHLTDRFLGMAPRNHSGKALARRNAARAENSAAEARLQELRVAGTRPAHPLAEYAGEYRHPGYGLMTFALAGDTLIGTYNGIRAPFAHWHFETFRGEAAGLEKALEGAKLTFRTSERGEVSGFDLALEGQVAPQFWEKQPDALLKDPAVLARLAGRYKLQGAPITVAVEDGALTAVVPLQPTYHLVPERSYRFRLRELQGYYVWFLVEPGGKVTGLEFQQPNGIFNAERMPENGAP